MPRFTSSILPPRPIVQRQAIAAAVVQTASASAVVEEKVIEVAADPGTALGNILQQYEDRITSLENPIP